MGTALEFSPVVVLAALLLVFLALVLFALVRLFGGASKQAGPTGKNEHQDKAPADQDDAPQGRRQGRHNLQNRRQGRWNDRWHIRQQGLGLRFKLALFTIVLVLFVISIVSVPLYYLMIREQHSTLLKSLWDRSTVLLEGFSASTGYLFHARNLEELTLITNRIAVIPEVQYVTITGSLSEAFVYRDHVFATNDPDILSKIDTPELQLGISILTDAVSPSLETMEWHTEARQPSSVPDFYFNAKGRHFHNVGQHEHNRYIFYIPFVFQYVFGTDAFRGLVRLEVSMDSIVREMESDRAMLERTILVIALAVLILGIFGALLLSSLIIRPIQRLVRHVEIVRDTKDKQNLLGTEIHINTRDEIAVLGDTINEMTQGLAAAAATASELSIGREIQKKFLPLELDRNGNKLSSGYKETENAFFFGYYAGAEGVSGDYFDYQDLDGRYYAIIKCDVAGKGIPAALIMIQVATMFLNYFKEWKPSPKGMQIEQAVYQINDFIETLKFEGRFAAFTLCIFDSQTGDLHFCNAGDNIIHIFDSTEQCIKNITLPETPAAGVISNSVVESKGGYHIQNLNLKRGDILLLYTDGIEEAKRKFRDAAFNEIICTSGPPGAIHGNHTVGEGSEEFGAERVQDIINAVMNRSIYTLYKWHNHKEAQELNFDFSGCQARVDELIMALISVEKIFRCHYDPQMVKTDGALVEKRIDDFLKKHFLQYEKYCAETYEYPDNNTYMYYTHLREDEQYDDLTILGVKRK